MRILFAAADRDLLMCYGTLLSEEFGEAVTAFDGTQVLTLLSNGGFDFAVIDSGIPRVSWSHITEHLIEKHIPALILTNEPITMGVLTSEPIACAYMTYPFFPEDIISEIKRTADKAVSDESFSVAGLGVCVRDFRINNGARLTSHEIDVLRSLAHGNRVGADDRTAVGALNIKFAGCGSNARIEYRSREGFQLVMNNE